MASSSKLKEWKRIKLITGCTAVKDKGKDVEGKLECPISDILDKHCGQKPEGAPHAAYNSSNYNFSKLPPICKLIEMNRRSRDFTHQPAPGREEEKKAPFLQESNIVDPFGLFNNSVAILYTGIYEKVGNVGDDGTCKPAKDNEVGLGTANAPPLATKKVGMIGIIYEIEYLRKLIDSSLEGCKYDPMAKECHGIENTTAGRRTRYLLYDHNKHVEILSQDLKFSDLIRSKDGAANITDTQQ